MRKGIVTFFGYAYDKNQIFQDIKDAGFDSVMASTDSRFFWETGDLDFQTKKMKELHLDTDSLHSTYVTASLPYMWQKGFKGYRILCGLKKDVKKAKKYGFKYLVVHTEGQISDIGLARFCSLVKFAQKNNVIIAIENLISNREILAYLFENIKSDYLKFCFDSGHENCFAGNMGVLEQFAHKLCCLHLHSNDGTSDMHTLNKYGNVDWDRIARILASIPNCDEIVLDYELIMHYKREENTPQGVLSECYKQACELENMIQKYKKQG